MWVYWRMFFYWTFGLIFYTEFVVLFSLLQENFENSRNNAKFVHKLSTIVCEILYDEWKSRCSYFEIFYPYWLPILEFSETDCFFCVERGSDNADDCPLFDDIMKKYTKFFKIYIENKGDLEMQCLMAVTEFVEKLQYPAGNFLLPITMKYESMLANE